MWVCLSPRHTWQSTSPSSFRTSRKHSWQHGSTDVLQYCPNFIRFSWNYWNIYRQCNKLQSIYPICIVTRADNTQRFGGWRLLGSYFAFRSSRGSAFSHAFFHKCCRYDIWSDNFEQRANHHRPNKVMVVFLSGIVLGYSSYTRTLQFGGHCHFHPSCFRSWWRHSWWFPFWHIHRHDL